MNPDSYRYKVGRFECIAICDGSLSTPIPALFLFKNAPKKLLSQALHAYNLLPDQWFEVFTPLVIQTGEHCVLVDTGIGIIDSAPNAGKLLQQLRDEGIDANQIDTVIISHAHGDHIGGNLDSDGRVAFPRAGFYIRKEEWDFWTSDETLKNPKYQWMAGFVDKNLRSIQERFHFLTQDIEIVPGIRTIYAPGHTPGNMVVCIESENDQLMYLGDVILHPIHVEHPDWYSDPDCIPSQVEQTRQKLFEYATVNHMLIHGFHLDFPGLGYILKQQGKWKWQSIEMMG